MCLQPWVPMHVDGTIPTKQWIRQRHWQIRYSFACRCVWRFTTNVPILTVGIGAYDQEIFGSFDATMAGTGRKYKSVASFNCDVLTFWTAQDQSRVPTYNPHCFMRSRMVMMIIEDAIPPLRWPSIATERCFKC